jgi:hypothetical protein
MVKVSCGVVRSVTGVATRGTRFAKGGKTHWSECMNVLVIFTINIFANYILFYFILFCFVLFYLFFIPSDIVGLLGGLVATRGGTLLAAPLVTRPQLSLRYVIYHIVLYVVTNA